MIPRECKRLAEVDFPIAAVSRHAAREKSIRHGHLSTLHLWWARRPLASSRAVLMALLLPDPCDEHCPEAFKKEAREILLRMHGRPSGWEAKIEPDEGLRQIILKFIADFANWDNAADRSYLETGRALVRAAHPEELPLVVDPFAGGGSIPLEALRLGCEAFASDLNPVALMILKVMLEDIPRHGPELADELRKVGGEIKAAGEKELADLYPADPDGVTPIAYLWARTVRCESPNCGAEIPLLRSLWLCMKADRRRALRTKIVRSKGQPPRLEFEIFEPTSDKEVAGGTVTRVKASCLCCGTVLPPERVRAQLSAEKGGADTVFDANGKRTGGARMTAVVTLGRGVRGRDYRLPNDADYAAVRKAQKRVAAILEKWERGGRQGLCPVPDETLPLMSGTFNVPLYGVTTWGQMFSRRQAQALAALCEQIKRLGESGPGLLLGCVLGRCADYWSSGVVWAQGGEFVAHTFGRQALPFIFDFAEAVPWTDSSGNFMGAVEWCAKVVENLACIKSTATVEIADARNSLLPDESSSVFFTDPPYYFAVPYADLSDYFFVWLKRAFPNNEILRDPFDTRNDLTPKKSELCEMAHWDSDRYPEKDQDYFEDGMAIACAEGRRILREDGVGSVVFAHKTTEGWEALLSGMIRGRWTITGSWPIATERPGRLRSQNSAALETSVHLVCRPRPEDAPVGDWAHVLQALPTRVAARMERLQDEGVRGADLVFACIGPALEIFSRYRTVETAEGRGVGLPEYLEKVWEVVGRAALEQVLGSGDATGGALEEDARLTALFLWTLQSTEAPGENGKKEEDGEEAVAKVAAKGLSLPFDMVRRFAQPMGIDLDIWTSRVIGQDKGVVRLLPVAERAKALFGEDGTRGAADWIESDTGSDLQAMLFPEMDAVPKKKARGRGRKAILSSDAELHSPDATTLDRVHAAMLLQSGGQANALRKLIGAEQDRGPDFLRLANALSALYPKGSEEKRLLDAMLLAVPR